MKRLTRRCEGTNSEIGQGGKVPIIVLDVRPVMSGTRGDQEIGRGRSDPILARFARQLETGAPDLSINRQFGNVALQTLENLFFMVSPRTVPEFESDHRAPNGLAGFQECANPPRDRRIAIRAKAVNPRRSVDERHECYCCSRNCFSSSRDIRLSQVPRCRVSAAIR